MKAHAVVLSVVLSLSLVAPATAGPGNAVTEWAAIVQPAIHNAAAPRSAGTSQVLHTMVMLAVYDAVAAIDGGYQPYASRIDAAPDADVNAAVATAAYLTARARVASSQFDYLDQQYAAYLSSIADGPARQAGIAVGEQAAAAIIARRANDGFNNVVLYACSTIPPPPGEFEPDNGCPSTPTSPQPVDAKVGLIKPFAIASVTQFRLDGPEPLTSKAYARDFDETAQYGRADSVVRTAEQTDVAYFWTEHPYVHWNRNLIALARTRGLDTMQTARFFATVHTAASDAVIAGFAAKYAHTFWRPRTAIPQADADDNPATVADPSWLPLLRVNHPEYPSGHGFWSGAVINAVAAFFGRNKLAWTITTSKQAVPQLVITERTYYTANELMDEISNARVWGGLHWRQSIRDGEHLGRRVATHVTTKFFRPAPGPKK